MGDFQNNNSQGKINQTLIFIIILVVAAIVFILLLYSYNEKIDYLETRLDEQNKLITENQSAIKELRNLKEISNAENKNTPAAQPQDDEIEVVIVKTPLKIGSKLNANNLTTIKMKKEKKPPESFSNLQEVIGRIASVPMSPKEVIVSTKLFDQNLVSQKVLPGYRGITIGADKILGLSSLVKPGSTLDLFVLIPKQENTKNSKKSYKTSKLLLGNVKVLSISSNIDPVTKAPVVNSVTFVVPNDKVPELVLALNGIGVEIQVVLRANNDSSEISKTEINSSEILPGMKPISKASSQINLPKKASPKTTNKKFNPAQGKLDTTSASKHPEDKKNAHNIEIIRANSRNNVTFENENR